MGITVGELDRDHSIQSVTPAFFHLHIYWEFNTTTELQCKNLALLKDITSAGERQYTTMQKSRLCQREAILSFDMRINIVSCISYKLKDASVWQFNGQKYLSVMSKCDIDEVDDIGCVDEDGVNEKEHIDDLKCCKIVIVNKY